MESVKKMIELFGIKTETVWTDRGVHLYFKKPTGFKGAKRVCALGFEVEYKHIKNTKAVTVKRGGVLRKTENAGVREDLPVIFSLKKKFNELVGMQEGDHRDNSLFTLRTQLAGVAEWRKIMYFVNEWVFAEPLDEKDMERLCRDMDLRDDKLTEVERAKELCKLLNVTLYGKDLFFRYSGKWHNDDRILSRAIIESVGDIDAYVVDKIKRNLENYANLIDDEKVFDIKLGNGILRNGKFYEIESDDFTPYELETEYDPEVEKDDDVEKYLNHLTCTDESYKQLLFEVLGHCFIVDPDFKRDLAKMFIWVGGGGNGKGTLLEVIRRILGRKNCSTLAVEEITKEQYLYSMHGKLANLGDDMTAKPINNDEIKKLKNITSCDGMPMRKLYEQSEDTRLTTTLIFTSNHSVKTFEKGESVKRRLVWFPMYAKPEKVDPMLLKKLTKPKALRYFLKNAVEGYMRLYQTGQFTQCGAVQEATLRWHDENDYSNAFLQYMCIEDLIDKKPPEVYDEYAEWVKENFDSENSPPKNPLQENIQRRFGLIPKQKKVNGRNSRVYAVE